jgi:capsular exopolysaccharide synthesis family protein
LPEAEGYRLLRAAILAAAPLKGRTGRILLVTSAMPCEGKTTTLANLGVSLAQSGKRVLLVDANLRNPSLHQTFGLPLEPGLATLLGPDGDALRSDTVRETSVPGLRVLTAGRPPANVAELLDRPRMGALLRELGSEADYVLLDSPAVLGVSDAVILAQGADAVLLVVDARATRSEALAQAVTALQPAGAQLLGVALNRGISPCAGVYYQQGRPISRSVRDRAARMLGRLVPEQRSTHREPPEAPTDPSPGAEEGPAPGGPLPSRGAGGEKPSHRGR